MTRRARAGPQEYDVLTTVMLLIACHAATPAAACHLPIERLAGPNPADWKIEVESEVFTVGEQEEITVKLTRGDGTPIEGIELCIQSCDPQVLIVTWRFGQSITDTNGEATIIGEAVGSGECQLVVAVAKPMQPPPPGD